MGREREGRWRAAARCRSDEGRCFVLLQQQQLQHPVQWSPCDHVINGAPVTIYDRDLSLSESRWASRPAHRQSLAPDSNCTARLSILQCNFSQRAIIRDLLFSCIAAHGTARCARYPAAAAAAAAATGLMRVAAAAVKMDGTTGQCNLTLIDEC